MKDEGRLCRAYETARDDLLAERDAAGHWVGKLSGSALSTVTATSALAVVREKSDSRRPDYARLERLIAGGINWLAGRRLAIVDDVAGVTRDRVSHLIEQQGCYFELIDTGGIGIQDVDNLTDEVEHQISTAIDVADVILFVVDTRSGITPLDQLVAERLRHVNKPILCLANKTDDPKLDPQADEFYRLGRGKVVLP